MLTNIRGLVERLELSAARGTMPLFEAISNAMDAIEEKSGAPTKGSIRIVLLPDADLMRQAGDETLVIDGFAVSDDGSGFNEANLTAFGEAYTRSKVRVGGKGVGRFTFLKVFSSVRVQSVFDRDGHHFERDFQFSIAEELKDADFAFAKVRADPAGPRGTR